MKLRLALITLLLFCLASPALAHALLLQASPEPNAALTTAPTKIELFFTEALEPSFSSIRVLDTTGASVDNGDTLLDSTDPTRLVVTLRTLPDGVYTVAWQVLSIVDGHVTQGAYPFAVGDVDAATLAAAEQASRKISLSLGEVLARWLTYLAAAALAGGALFRLVVWRPAYHVIKNDFGPALIDPTQWHQLATFAALCLVLGNTLALLTQAGQAIGAEIAAPWSQATGEVLFATRYGALWLARAGLSLVLAVLAVRARRPRVEVAVVSVAPLLFLVLSLGSHAAAEPQPLWPIASDWIHLLAASAWVGGLLYFGAGLWAARHLAPEPRTRLTATLLPRFSALALVSVGVLSLTGFYNALLRIGEWAALTNTFYGQVLLVKLGLALLMVGFGANNLLFITPRLKHAPNDSPITLGFRWLVLSEAGVSLLLMLSVAVLTVLAPARAAAPPGLAATARADDLALGINITPGRVGVNTFTLKVTANGQPVTGAKEVALRFTPLSGTQAVASSEIILREDQPGLYSARGANFSLSEQWQVQAVVRRVDQFDAFANFNFNLSATSVASVAWTRWTGVLLLLMALAYLGSLRALVRTRGQLVALALAPAVGLFAVGSAVFLRAPPDRADLVNPIPPNADSIARGQSLYQENCIPCHGPTGQGDGPVGLTLNPRPADLSQHAVLGIHPDGRLYGWLTNGFAGSVMPAFKDKLSNDDRWHVVNYIRTLAKQ